MLKLKNKATGFNEEISTKDFFSALTNVDTVNKEIFINNKTYEYDNVVFASDKGGNNDFVLVGEVTAEMIAAIPAEDKIHVFAFQNGVPANSFVSKLVIVKNIVNPTEISVTAELFLGEFRKPFLFTEEGANTGKKILQPTECLLTGVYPEDLSLRLSLTQDGKTFSDIAGSSFKIFAVFNELNL